MDGDTQYCMFIPNVLASNVQDAEQMYSLIKATPISSKYVLDMKIVDFMKPYGVIALISVIRHLHTLSNQAVKIIHLSDQLYLYLERMNFFSVTAEWLEYKHFTDEEWSRNPQTPNLLELTTIAGVTDVENIVIRAEKVFSTWLDIPELGQLLRVLSELCANVYEHSGDKNGCILIQKYERHTEGQVVVSLAVGDFGCGIRGSLMNRFGRTDDAPIMYLRKAMSCLTDKSIEE
jgi:hypothetical protein